MDKGPQRILIAVKPWETDLPLAASHARFLAQSLNAQILLMSCVSESPSAVFTSADPAEATVLPTRSAEGAEEELAQLAQPLRNAGVAVIARVSSRSPTYQAILDEAADWQADLVVVGVHEPTPLPHTRLTDIDWQLMRLCPCPLLLARDPNIESYRAILAAVDPLHRHAEPAGLDQAVLSTAKEFSRAFNARLCVTNIYPNPEDYETVSAVQVEPGVFYGTEDIEAAHRKAVGDLIDECGIAPSETVLRAGEPAAVIAEITRERRIDLVVLGSIKRGRLQAAVLGSTAEAVVADTLCDVLLVKPQRE